MSLQQLFGVRSRRKILKRFKEILYILIKNGFEDVVGKYKFFKVFLGLKNLIYLRRTGKKIKQKLSTAERLRLTFQQLGPTFIKLGQLLSNRPDLVPFEYVEEFKKLQDRVEPFPSERAISILEKEFGKKIDEIFTEFDTTPIASASIAQVHRGVLKNGKEVAVKIKRPDIDEMIELDFEILKRIFRFAQKRYTSLRQYKPVEVIEELKKTIKKELNLQNEILHLEIYKNNFKDYKYLHIPEVYHEYSSSNVITMEFIHGTRIDDVSKLKSKGIDIKEVVSSGLKIVVDSIFKFKFFHADPHPGNFFVRDDGVIALLDFGIMGYLSESMVDKILSFMYGVLTGDTVHLIYTLIEMKVLPQSINIDKLESEVEYILNKYRRVTIGELNVVGFLEELFMIFKEYRVNIPVELMLVFKTMGILEGMAVKLIPEFNPVKELRKYILPIYVEKFSDPDYYAKVIANSIYRNFVKLKGVPDRILNILSKIEEGSVKIDENSLEKIKNTISRENSRKLSFFTAVMMIAFGYVNFLATGEYGFSSLILTFFGSVILLFSLFSK